MPAARAKALQAHWYFLEPTIAQRRSRIKLSREQARMHTASRREIDREQPHHPPPPIARRACDSNLSVTLAIKLTRRTQDDTKKRRHEAGARPRFFAPPQTGGAGFPPAEGSVNPPAGFTFN